MDKWRKWATVVHRTSAYIQFLSSIVFPYLWVKRAECGLSSVCYHPLNGRTTCNDNTFTIFDPFPADEGNANQNDDIWSWGSHTFLVVPGHLRQLSSALCRLQMTCWTFAVLFEDCASCKCTFTFNCLKTEQRHFKGNGCPGMLEEFSRTDKLKGIWTWKELGNSSRPIPPFYPSLVFPRGKAWNPKNIKWLSQDITAGDGMAGPVIIA